MLREALKISSPLALVSREVPRFHGGSLWHSTPGNREVGGFVNSAVNRTHEPIILCIVYPNTRIKYYYY